MKTFLRIVILLLCLIPLVSSAGSAQGIDQIVFFGDSLSDPGNHFVFTAQNSQAPFSVEPPSASYDVGDHHFSNSSTWAERLATALHRPTSGHPALRAPGRSTNYAVGRARARAGAPEFPDFDLRTQVEHYLADFNGRVPADILAAVWIGGNDISDALNAFMADPTGATSAEILQASLTATGDAIIRLHAAGVRMFLVANLPDFAYTPYSGFLDENVCPGIAAVATSLTNSYNAMLGQLVTALPWLLPADPGRMQFIRLLDANAIIGQLVASPASFGIADASNRCTRPGVIDHAICSIPERYLFWDGIHPTSTGHDAVANAAIRLLEPK